MTRFAGLLAFCLCSATIVMASNPDQRMGATTPNKVKAIQFSATRKDKRDNVMQAPKLQLWNGPAIPKGDIDIQLPLPTPNQLPPSPPAQ